ncbi:MAG: hypothetical protein A2X64_07365 [Ignavibacteria bacterium GWF2_33_9]|nr:MAG: hypothetical protein A2X64_07365 [Ignavibacteria bacterium GWF2_33_9]
MNKTLQSELLLILTAIIWGSAFVFQKIGGSIIGPFAFGGIRFLIGASVLLPIIYFQNKKDKSILNKDLKKSILSGVIIGIALFLAISFQQIGINNTSVGNAGFITGFYIILVPFFGIFLKNKIQSNHWVGAILALIGLFLLSNTTSFSLQYGDLLVFISTFFWAFQILLIGHFSPKSNPILLSAIEFYTCAILSIITSLFFETVTITNIMDASIPILYTGIMSTGVGFTIQVIAQKHIPATPAAIIFSSETLFAALAGWIFLNEIMTSKSLIGCVFMLLGIIICQIDWKKSKVALSKIKSKA